MSQELFMKKVVVFGYPYLGHLYPMIDLLVEMNEQGIEVVFYTNEKFAELIPDNIKVKGYRNIEHLNKRSDFVTKETQNYKELAMVIKGVLKISNDILDEMKEDFTKEASDADCILTDSLAYWGRFVAQVTQRPCVPYITSFLLSHHFQTPDKFYSQHFFGSNVTKNVNVEKKCDFRRIFRTLLKDINLKYELNKFDIWDLFEGGQELNIAFSYRNIQLNSNEYGEEYIFLGPQMKNRLSKQRNSGKIPDFDYKKEKFIFVSLGTVASNNNGLFLKLYKELLPIDRKIVICSPFVKLEEKEDHIYISEHWNQVELLKYCDVFVTHGGANSVNEALYLKTPLLIIPLINDQFWGAEIVERFSFGKSIYINEIESELAKSINDRIKLNEYRDNLRRADYVVDGDCGEAISRITYYCKNFD